MPDLPNIQQSILQDSNFEFLPKESMRAKQGLESLIFYGGDGAASQNGHPKEGLEDHSIVW